MFSPNYIFSSSQYLVILKNRIVREKISFELGLDGRTKDMTNEKEILTSNGQIIQKVVMIDYLILIFLYFFNLISIFLFDF